MKKAELTQFIQKQQSFLCVGLDTDPSKIPTELLKEDDPVFAFNKLVIDATKDYCVAYKPNIAFYEALGSRGWRSLEKTLDYIPASHFTIADAKRGDIGNTSKLYAKAFFETYEFDAVTVAPYMGIDSVTPFLEFEDKWVIILALTSNQGSRDFQFFKDQSEVRLYEQVLKTCASWGTSENTMFVVGATQASRLAEIRSIVPDHFLLIPGVGAQGGDLDAVWNYGSIKDIGLIVNSSRGIIYAGSQDGEDPSVGIRNAAATLQSRMASYLGSEQ